MSLLFTFLTSVIASLNVAEDLPYFAIKDAFEKNDAQAISMMSRTKVLINILGEEGVYSQSQASLVLKDFFKRKQGSTFNFFFKGQESSDSSFAIANYKSKSGNCKQFY